MDFVAKPNKVIDSSTFKATSINVEIFSVDKVMERKIGSYKRDYHLIHKTESRLSSIVYVLIYQLEYCGLKYRRL